MGVDPALAKVNQVAARLRFAGTPQVVGIDAHAVERRLTPSITT